MLLGFSIITNANNCEKDCDDDSDKRADNCNGDEDGNASIDRHENGKTKALTVRKTDADDDKDSLDDDSNNFNKAYKPVTKCS